VREQFDGKIVWEGVVQIFDLAGHPSAIRAHAWSALIEGSMKRRFFAVLNQPINSPQVEVQAAIIAEHRNSQKHLL